MDWFGSRINCESSLARYSVGLGASLTFNTRDYRLGDFPAYHGWVVDLGILLVRNCALVSDRWHGRLDGDGDLKLCEGFQVSV